MRWPQPVREMLEGPSTHYSLLARQVGQLFTAFVFTDQVQVFHAFRPMQGLTLMVIYGDLSLEYVILPRDVKS